MKSLDQIRRDEDELQKRRAKCPNCGDPAGAGYITMGGVEHCGCYYEEGRRKRKHTAERDIRIVEAAIAEANSLPEDNRSPLGLLVSEALAKREAEVREQLASDIATLIPGPPRSTR